MVYIRLEKIKQKALQNKVPIMEDEGLSYLLDYVKKNNIKTILEIGSAVGYSAISMALLDPDIHITTIERDYDASKEAEKNISSCGLEHQITLIKGDALEIAVAGQYDLIFIDGAKAQYIKFFEKFAPFLKQNGSIISDNLLFHGLVEDHTRPQSKNLKALIRKIKTYIDYLENHPRFYTEFIKIGDGLAISKRIPERNE